MAEQTARFAMPLLAAGQAGKELTHNEALTLIDMLVQPTVVAVGTDVPPAMPEPGQCWIVGSAPTGVWAGRTGHIAGWTIGGWRFAGPREGITGWCISTGKPIAYRDGLWREGDVLCAKGAAIADPVGSGGDASARAAIGAILTAMRQHGLIAR